MQNVALERFTIISWYLDVQMTVAVIWMCLVSVILSVDYHTKPNFKETLDIKMKLTRQRQAK